MQFSGLLKKDFLLWRRNLGGSICEILLPIMFLAILLLLNTLTEKTEITAESNSPYVLPTNDDLLNPAFFKTQPLFKDCSNKNRKGGRVAIVPENNFTKTIQPLFDALEYETVFFNDKQEIEDLIQSSDYTEPFDNSTWRQFCFTVEFDEFEQEKFEYTIRFNTSGPWPRKDHWDTIESKPYISFVKDDENSLFKMRTGGLFLLKNYIDNKIFNQEVSKKLTVGLTRFKVEPYTTSTLYDTLSIVVSVLIIFILIFPFIRIIGQVVTDRETLVLQNMENMGMKKHVYFWSTLFFYYLKSFFIVLVITILLKIFLLKDIGFFFVFFMLLFGAYCYINLGFFVSCFFVQSKKAIITGIVVFFALNLGASILTSVQDSRGGVLFLVLLSPNIGLEVMKDGVLRAQTNFSALNLGTLDSITFNIPFYTIFLILILQFVVYMLIGLYCFYVGNDLLRFLINSSSFYRTI